MTTKQKQQERSFLGNYKFLIILLLFMASCKPSYILHLNKGYIDAVKIQNPKYKHSSILKLREELLRESISYSKNDTLALLEFYSNDDGYYALYFLHKNQYYKYTRESNLEGFNRVSQASDSISDYHKMVLRLIADGNFEKVETMIIPKITINGNYTVIQAINESVIVKLFDGIEI